MNGVGRAVLWIMTIAAIALGDPFRRLRAVVVHSTPEQLSRFVVRQASGTASAWHFFVENTRLVNFPNRQSVWRLKKGGGDSNTNVTEGGMVEKRNMEN